MDVGLSRISGNDMVPNTIGKPPASSTPRFTASTNSGICR